jgi:hypothetical protein
MRSKNIFMIFIFLEIIIVIFGFVFDGFSLEGLQTITRFSGRLSLAYFSIVFLLKDRYPNSSVLISDRPYLLFAILHGIHLVELISFVTLSGKTLVPYRVLGGFMAYVFIFVMPFLTSMETSGRVSTKAYARFEMLFMGYIWFIFFMSYLPRVLGKLPGVGGAYWEHALLFSWVIIIAALKLFSAYKFTPARNV